MIIPYFKILLIGSLEKQDLLLSKILLEQNYLVDSVKKAEEAIPKVIDDAFDLIICLPEKDAFDGFQVYQMLKSYLISKGISFFLCIENYNEDIILMGLEMGIDNFIMCPVDATILNNKIENYLKKTKEFNVFEAKQFKVYIENSPLAMFSTLNYEINFANDTFCKLFSVSKEMSQKLSIHELFNLLEQKSNILMFRKLINGLFHQCCLKNVKVIKNSQLLFDIHLSHIGKIGSGKILGKILPVGMYENYSLNNVKSNNILQDSKLSEVNFGENVEKQKIHLTLREKQVLEESAKGLPIKLIASLLNLSHRTVEKHRSNIMEKTNTKNIIEAINIALKHNLLENYS